MSQALIVLKSITSCEQFDLFIWNNTSRKRTEMTLREQTCYCQRVKSCSAVIFVWQVRDESTMFCASHSLKTFDFQDLLNGVEFLIKEGWIMLLFPCQLL